MLLLKNYLLILVWFNKILFYTLNKYRKEHEYL